MSVLVYVETVQHSLQLMTVTTRGNLSKQLLITGLASTYILYLCMYACTYVSTYVQMWYTYMYAWYIRTYVHMYVRIYKCRHVRTYVRMYKCGIYVCMVHTYVRTYVRIYKCRHVRTCFKCQLTQSLHSSGEAFVDVLPQRLSSLRLSQLVRLAGIGADGNRFKHIKTRILPRCGGLARGCVEGGLKVGLE